MLTKQVAEASTYLISGAMLCLLCLGENKALQCQNPYLFESELSLYHTPNVLAFINTNGHSKTFACGGRHLEGVMSLAASLVRDDFPLRLPLSFSVSCKYGLKKKFFKNQ